MANRIMKGEQCDDLSIVKLPVLVQPKFDGIRICKQNGVALTGQLKELRKKGNKRIADLIENYCPNNIDGEIWWPDVKFEEIQSVVRSYDKELPEGFKIQVFDLIDNKLTARERNDKLFVEIKLPNFCQKVDTKLCHSLESVNTFETEVLEAGHEGIMLRYVNGIYKFGRSTLREQCLMKRKPFVDDEALVVGFIEKEHNDNTPYLDERGLMKRSSSKAGKVLAGTLGALVVSHPTYGTFNVGGGWTHVKGQEIWDNREKYLNRLVTFKFQPNHVKDKPTAAQYKDFRS